MFQIFILFQIFDNFIFIGRVILCNEVPDYFFKSIKDMEFKNRFTLISVEYIE